MRNIAVFARLVIFFHIPFTAFAEAPRYSFTIAPMFGVTYGQSTELVFLEDKVLSELLWDAKGLCYFGLALDFFPRDPFSRSGFYAAGTFRGGLPGRTGVIEDRDWMSKVNADLTHYSTHDNFTQQYFRLDGAAGFSFPPASFFFFRAFAGVSYMRFSFSAENGSGVYARETSSGIYDPIDANPKTENFYGTVIKYTQDWLIFAPGIQADFRFLKLFEAGLSFQISPLIFCAGNDKHLTRMIQFSDRMSGGLFLEPGARFSFNAASWLVLTLECSWRYIGGVKGQSYRKNFSDAYYVKDGEAGAGLSLLDAGLLVKVRI